MNLEINFLPFVITLITTTLIWAITYKVTDIQYFREVKFRRHVKQLIRFCIAFIALIAIILSLPVNETVRGQIVTLMGIVVSGVLAFASSSVLANLMAGMMIRINRPFLTGDFIQVNAYFGRVIEQGMFETKIQSEHSKIIAIPNTYLISHPVEVTPPDFALVSVELSLGYDIHHNHIEPLLIRAANDIGLTDAFSQVLQLGDYSVSYRVSGVLGEVKTLLTMHSNLRRALMDILHQENIEIVSPSFMNQRPIGELGAFIPKSMTKDGVKKHTKSAETVVFNKAEEALKTQEEIEKLSDLLKTLQEKIKTEEDDDIISEIKSKMEKIEIRKEKLIEKTS